MQLRSWMPTTLLLAAAALLFATSPGAAQTAPKRAVAATPVVTATADDKDRANQNTVTIVTGTPAGTYLAIAYDMSAVLDDGDNLRVLAIAGKGSVQNVRDILNLRGVDMGIVQSDVMSHFKQEVGAGIDQRLVYITKLYNEEMHLVTSADIKDIKDLAGRKVNFAEVGSGTQYSARLVFRLLGIGVEEVNMGQNDALVKIKSGEIAATVFIVGRPAAVLAKLAKDPALKLTAVPYTDELENNSYLPATLTAKDYPALIAEGGQVETIAVGAVLAVYNWPARTDRHRRVTNFINAFFGKFDEFQQPARHPKWKEVNFSASLKGWNRFPAAKTALEQRLAQTGSVETAGQPAAGAGRDQEELFRKFMEWRKAQQR